MRRLIACAAAAAIIVTATPVTAQAAVSQRPLTAATFNDGVKAVAHHSGTFYVGGDFTTAYYDGDSHDRSHLAAVGSDGVLRSFAPQLDGAVHGLAADGEYLYVSGSFSQIDGLAKKRVARFELASGELDPDFNVSIDALPRTLVVSDERLYIGGDFNSVNKQPRSKLAAVSTRTGALIEDFTPDFDRGVRGLEAADGKRLYVAGGFTTVNGEEVRNLAAIDRFTGEIDNGFAATTAGVVYDVHSYGGRVYAAVGGPGGRVTAYEASDGGIAWERLTDGDVVTLTPYDGTIYVGGHFEKVCKGTELGDDGKCLDGVFADRRKLLALSTDNTLQDWNPDADSVIGTLTLEHGSGTVVAGGTFLTFNEGGIRSRGLAMFRQ